MNARPSLSMPDLRVARIGVQLEVILRLAADRAASHVLDKGAISTNPKSFERCLARLLARGSDSTDRARRLRAWARASHAARRPGPIIAADSVEDLVRSGAFSVPIRDDLSSLVDEVQLPRLPDFGGAFSTLELHVDSVTCIATTRLDRKTDEPLLAIVTLGADGKVSGSEDLDLGTFEAGQSRPINRRVASFPLAQIPAFSLFGSVLHLIEQDNDDGGTVNDALDDAGFGEVIAGAVAILALALTVPIVELPVAIGMVVFVALDALAVVILELASRNDVLGARRVDFTLPPAFLSAEPRDTHVELSYSGHGASYKAAVRWHLF